MNIGSLIHRSTTPQQPPTNPTPPHPTNHPTPPYHPPHSSTPSHHLTTPLYCLAPQRTMNEKHLVKRGTTLLKSDVFLFKVRCLGEATSGRPRHFKCPIIKKYTIIYSATINRFFDTSVGLRDVFESAALRLHERHRATVDIRQPRFQTHAAA